jgi:hypothetical protein
MALAHLHRLIERKPGFMVIEINEGGWTWPHLGGNSR